MADIFLSYNRDDQAVARCYAEAFEAQSLSVWWDVTLRPGEAYDEVTEKALRTARAVVVLWSKKSVDSRWVRAEATLAQRNGTFVPVMIEPCERPIMFELTQSAELFDWQGDVADKRWVAFIGAVQRRFEPVGTPRPTESAAASSAGSRPSAAPEPPRAAQPRKVSVVVLPFTNMSGDAEQEYFSDGISEDIITDLSKVSALSVTARNTAFTFKGKHVDVPQVAQQLKVTHVLEGSVRKAGNRVRITAQLISGATGDHVWAERYDRDLSDIFALQDELSQAIVAALKLKLFPQEKHAIEDRGTSTIEDFDKYLRARALYNTMQPQDLVRSAKIYGELIANDPTFTRARIGLVEVYYYQLIYSPERNAETMRALEEAVASALVHARDDWSTQFAITILHFQRREWAEAERAYALAADRAAVPYSGLSELRAWMLLTEGRVTEAAVLLRATNALDPLSVGRSFLLQTALFSSGQAEAAEAEYQRSLDLPGQREAIEHIALMRVWADGDARLVRSRFDRFLSHAVVPMPTLEAIRDVHDNPAAALALLHVAAADPANSDATRQMLLGQYASHFGDIELALASLRRATLHSSGGVTINTLWWPGMAAARRAPGFKRLIRDLGLYDYWRQSGHWADFARPVGDDDFEVFRLMPDIFLSYNREDQATARRFAESFEAQGFSVWWDATLRSGEAYDEVTEKALREAKAVVVLWSKKSVVSRWVRAEATLASRNKTLVPAMIEPCDRPIMFELTQTAELFHWQGDVADKVWLAFLGDVRRFVDAQSGSTSPAPAAKLPAAGSPPAASRPNRVCDCRAAVREHERRPRAGVLLRRHQRRHHHRLEQGLWAVGDRRATRLSRSRASMSTCRRSRGKLDVTHVLEGSVRKAGNRVRITAQLIHGASNGSRLGRALRSRSRRYLRSAGRDLAGHRRGAQS